MAERRSKRLEPVKRLEAMREDKALQQLAHAMQQLQQARQRLAQLEGFSSEYRARMLGGAGGTISGRSLHGMARFQDHLEGLMQAQLRIGQGAEDMLARAREQWRSAHARQRAVSSVIGRFEQSEALDDARQEQREMDEQGLRRRDF